MQTAADGNEAIDLVQKARDAGQSYDIVFLDWNMPTISGLEVLTYFRAKTEYADTAFVMLTAESEQQNIMKAIKAVSCGPTRPPRSMCVGRAATNPQLQRSHQNSGRVCCSIVWGGRLTSTC